MSNYYTVVFHLYRWKYQLEENLKSKKLISAIPDLTIPFSAIIKSLFASKTQTVGVLKTSFGVLYFLGLMVMFVILFS